MDLTTRWNTPGLEVQTVTAAEKCAICTRRTSEGMFALHERVELDVPCQTWLLCRDCASAVVTQVEQSPLHSPLRIRIAVGLVAAERKPRRRHTPLELEFWDEMPNQQVEGLVVAFVLIMFLLPPVVFLLVTALAVTGVTGH